MSLMLRQSTEIEIRMGPYIARGNGVVPVTSATIGSADEAEVLKADGLATAAMAGAFTAVSGCDGWYDYTATATDTNTVGEVVFVMHDDSSYLPVFVRAQVVEEAVYDALFAASANFPAQIARLIIPQTNIALDDLYFKMVDETDHITPEPSLTPVATKSLDGGTSFVATTGTVTEIALGVYKFDASAADVNGATVMFKFSATGADDAFLIIPKLAA